MIKIILRKIPNTSTTTIATTNTAAAAATTTSNTATASTTTMTITLTTITTITTITTTGEDTAAPQVLQGADDVREQSHGGRLGDVANPSDR